MQHRCHWPGCIKPVPPSMWGCRSHWFTLPSIIRSAIWNTYRSGQETTKNPSKDYLEATAYAHKWAIAHQKDDQEAEEIARNGARKLLHRLTYNNTKSVKEHP